MPAKLHQFLLSRFSVFASSDRQTYIHVLTDATKMIPAWYKYRVAQNKWHIFLCTMYALTSSNINQPIFKIISLSESGDCVHKKIVIYFGPPDKIQLSNTTRSSATAKSTARPSCLVGVLYDIYRETNNRSTANQPLVRN